jgi:hypothetical protein
MNLIFLRALALLMCALLPVQSVTACSISVNESSPLERNKVSLSGDAVVKVAQRLVDAPIGFNGQWEVYVFGFAFPSESRAKELAERRKAYAISVLTDILRVAPERIASFSGAMVYSSKSEKRAKTAPDRYAGVDIGVVPICPPGGCNLCQADTSNDVAANVARSNRDDAADAELLRKYPHSAQISFYDESSGKPAVAIPYRVVFPSGIRAEGRTDAQGRTARFRTERPEKLEVQVLKAYLPLGLHGTYE